MITKIPYIFIDNFKSIHQARLWGLTPFSVFAGPNGSGKSNFFEAMKFVSLFVKYGLVDALDMVGGTESIRSYFNEDDEPFCFRMRIAVPFDDEPVERHYAYSLTIHDLSTEPVIEEQLESPIFIRGDDGSYSPSTYPLMYRPADQSEIVAQRIKGKDLVLFYPLDSDVKREPEKISLTKDKSILMISPHTMLPHYVIHNISLFNIDPNKAKLPSLKGKQSNNLNEDGSNLAGVLLKLFKDDNIRDDIIDWLSLIVPGLEGIESYSNDFNNTVGLKIKEIASDKAFPAHLISDGTIYFVSLMAAIYSSSKYGYTLYEEPENGMHPKAIAEAVAFMRDKANHHPIFVTTHSESLVKNVKKDELWLVDKKEGKTIFTPARDTDLEDVTLSMDEIWLSNAFGAGLPW